MIEQIHPRAFILFLFNETTVKCVWLKDRKIFVFVERNMTQRHLLEINSDCESRPRTEEAAARNTSFHVFTFFGFQLLLYG